MNVVACPFNKLHVMPKETLQNHIIKCMKNYPNHYVCSHNSLHRFLDRNEHIQHALSCPDRSVDLPRLREPIAHGVFEQRPTHLQKIREFNFEEENWEDN